MKLNHQDLQFAVLRLPKKLKTILTSDQWQGRVFVGGGYLRSVITRELVNDIDLFVPSADLAELLALKLVDKPHKTANAFTIAGNGTTIQIIHRWVFDKLEDVANSFDFTICCGVIGYADKRWDSFCCDTYYQDMAAKRLVYRNPVRNEDAGGSLLRVLKYYQKGYRIPLDSMGMVVARTIVGVRTDLGDVESTAKVITGLLRVVDPSIDPTHEAHLPPSKELNDKEENHEF